MKDRYSLPEIFCRMGFSTVEDQRNAIIQQNGKTLGFKGPRLLVQRYVSETGVLVGGDSKSNVSFGDVGQRFLKSKADTLHKKIQLEEEERTAPTGSALHLRGLI